ncbi:MAG TPA: helix-turn-helix domain-containing protein [Euzebyales bacterium]|nr:helix-turn-helix domain-containing protein [Euzebyales bacterium]
MSDAWSVERRAAVHRALGDEHRLAIIDLLWSGDRTPAELQDATGLRSNLVAFHLNTLQDAGLISRHASHGDGRRRYVTVTTAALPHVGPVAPLTLDCVLFVCTHNAARSQLAAALWRHRSGHAAVSAGTQPADRVHPTAVAVAADHGLDLSDAQPTHIADITVHPDLVVSVCDRAHETGLDVDAPHRHWSIPDPVGGDRATFEHAFDLIAGRIDRLAATTA